jgi:hypothetical protein
LVEQAAGDVVESSVEREVAAAAVVLLAVEDCYPRSVVAAAVEADDVSESITADAVRPVPLIACNCAVTSATD